MRSLNRRLARIVARLVITASIPTMIITTVTDHATAETDLPHMIQFDDSPDQLLDPSMIVDLRTDQTDNCYHAYVSYVCNNRVIPDPDYPI